jgi:hypothetical protein
MKLRPKILDYYQSKILQTAHKLSLISMLIYMLPIRILIINIVLEIQKYHNKSTFKNYISLKITVLKYPNILKIFKTWIKKQRK